MREVVLHARPMPLQAHDVIADGPQSGEKRQRPHPIDLLLRLGLGLTRDDWPSLNNRYYKMPDTICLPVATLAAGR